MTILIVYDSAFARKRLREILEGAGYKVQEADGGPAALQMLNEIAPELITVDLLMPEMDGLELIRRIRATRPTVPILVHSADIQHATAGAALAAGASAFIGKTSRPAEVVEAVRRLLAVPQIALSAMQRDAFTEMMNIAVGQAALALNTLLERPVELCVPHVQIVEATGLRAFFEREMEQVGALVIQRHTGPLNGLAALALPDRHAALLIRLLLKATRDLAQLSPTEQAALAEVGNIILNATLARLGDEMGGRLQISLPSVALNLTTDAATELLFSSAPGIYHAIVILSRLTIGEAELTAYIVLLLPGADVERLLERLNRTV